MIHRLTTPFVTLAFLASLTISLSAYAQNAASTAAYQPLTRADLVKLPPQAQATPATLSAVSAPVGSTQPTPAVPTQPLTRADLVKLPPQAQATLATLPNIQAGSRAATNAARNEAVSGIAGNTGLSRGASNAIVNGAINGNLQSTGTRLAVNTGQRQATDALTRSGVGGSDARAITGAAGALAQGNTRGATRVAVGAGQRQATDALTRSGVGGSDARAITGAAGALAQGNTRGATRVAVGAGQRHATDALTRSGVGGSDARAITGAAGALAQGNTRGAARIAVNAGARHLSDATGLPTGLTRSVLGGLAGGLGNGRSSRPSNPSFKQVNDYVAASDDGIIRYTADGRLSSALRNSGFGGSGRYSLTPEGLVRDATGLVAGRLDRTTGKLFDAAGKEIAGNSLLGNRIQSDIRASVPTTAPAVTSASAAAKAAGIPVSFNNSTWDAATRQSEWAKLPATQQSAWLREAALKSNPSGNAGAAITQSLVQTANNRGSVPTL